jgi:hypothetical protein
MFEAQTLPACGVAGIDYKKWLVDCKLWMLDGVLTYFEKIVHRTTNQDICQQIRGSLLC